MPGGSGAAPRLGPLCRPFQRRFPPPRLRAVKKERRSRSASTRSRTAARAAQTSLARLQIVLTAQQQVWISADVDGKPGYRGTMGEGEIQTIQGEERIKLFVGNAGALGVTLNGKPVGPVGKTGEVVVLELTPEGSQTVRRNPVVFDDSLDEGPPASAPVPVAAIPAFAAV